MAFIHKDTFKIYNHSMIGCNDIEDVGAFFEVDDIIAPIISKLNIKGYNTEYCCQGHPYKLLDDDIFTSDSLEKFYDKSNYLGIHSVIPISSDTKYVFYEFDENPRAYIMFKDGVRLPYLPTGWNVSKECLKFTIEKIYDISPSPLSFFVQLVRDMNDMLKFVEKLPPCTTSLDIGWNELIEEITNKLPDINDTEIAMIRDMYVEGESASYIIDTLVDFED